MHKKGRALLTNQIYSHASKRAWRTRTCGTCIWMCCMPVRRQKRERVCVYVYAYEPVPRKSYSTENAFNNHIQSKRHKEMEAMEPVAKLAGNNNNNKGSSDRSRDPFLECLFCAHPSDTFDANMDHMKTEHAFFLPDVEYLVDAQGLVAYLSRKVHDCICVYCNGRGRRWKTVDAVRSHMVSHSINQIDKPAAEN